MQPDKLDRKNPFTLQHVVVILVVAVVVAVLWRQFDSVWEPGRRLERTARAMIGRHEADLLTALGPPKHIVHADTPGGGPVEFPSEYLHFLPVPRRPVRDRVLLYSEFNLAVYVYIDSRGIVEHVAVAAT
jgi:hypothetical protein